MIFLTNKTYHAELNKSWKEGYKTGLEAGRKEVELERTILRKEVKDKK